MRKLVNDRRTKENMQGPHRVQDPLVVRGQTANCNGDTTMRSLAALRGVRHPGQSQRISLVGAVDVMVMVVKTANSGGGAMVARLGQHNDTMMKSSRLQGEESLAVHPSAKLYCRHSSSPSVQI